MTQRDIILNHLRLHGSISQMEARELYRVAALPRRIADLREREHRIVRVLKKDPTGRMYARYSLEAA